MDEDEAGSKKNKGKLFGVKEGVEGVILDAVLKPLVSRVAEMKLTELDALVNLLSVFYPALILFVSLVYLSFYFIFLAYPSHSSAH